MTTAAQDDLDTTADVSAQRVSRVYAEALLNAGQRKSQADDVLEELDSLVHDIFRADPSFHIYLTQSAAGRERKAEVIRKGFGGRGSETFLNFLLVLRS